MRVSAKYTEECIMEVIRQRPGSGGPLIADVVGLGKDSIHIHLRNLQAEGKIEKRGETSAARFFPAGAAA